MIYNPMRMRNIITSYDTYGRNVARGTFAMWTLGGIVVGGAFTQMQDASPIFAIAAAVLGGLIGAGASGAASFRYRERAETLACLYQLEQNTRPAEQRNEQRHEKNVAREGA